MERIGLYGGTFNPPHLGHLRVARLAVSALGLDRLYVCPNFVSPFKRAMDDPGPEVRFELVQALCADDEALVPWSVELDRAGPSYTFDTLTHMAALHPDAKRFFVCGADAALTLNTWYRASELAGLAAIAAVARVGETDPDAATLRQAMPDGVTVVALGYATEGNVSSTTVRYALHCSQLDRAARNLPDRVADIVFSRDLYRDPDDLAGQD